MKKIKMTIWERVFVDSILSSGNFSVKGIFIAHKIFEKIKFIKEEKEKINLREVLKDNQRTIVWDLDDKYEKEISFEDEEFKFFYDNIIQKQDHKYSQQLVDFLSKLERENV